MSGPRRATTQHNHPEYWTEADHYRFEDRITTELHELRQDVNKLSSRLTWLLGGLSLASFLVTLFARVILPALGVNP